MAYSAHGYVTLGEKLTSFGVKPEMKVYWHTQMVTCTVKKDKKKPPISKNQKADSFLYICLFIKPKQTMN